MLFRLLTSAALLALSSLAIAQSGANEPKVGVKPPAATKKAPAKAHPKVTEPLPSASTDEAERARTIERIFECLASGLPQDWWRTWVEIFEKGEIAWNERSFEGRYFYLTDTERNKPKELSTCDATEVAVLTVSLNQFLDPEKRRWKAVRLEFNRGDGSFELKYDYGQ